jgi:hypothetical protein
MPDVQQQLPLGDEPPPEQPDDAIPLVYVASALTHLDTKGRGLIDGWCNLIKRAVTEITETAEEPWRLRIHLPIDWTAPWADDKTPAEEVYRRNTDTIYGAAALVLIGLSGGSFGAGQEFAIASALRLPVLYLRYGEEPISRQVLGTPVDLVVVKFTRPDDLTDAVVRFLRSRRVELDRHARRSADRAMALEPLRSALEGGWTGLDDDRQTALAVEARIPRRRIIQIIGSSAAIAAASLDELRGLAGALGISLGGHLAAQPLPDLDPQEVSALRTAAAEYDWEGTTTLDLLQAARLEHARGGVRRFRLASVDDWVEFQARYQR